MQNAIIEGKILNIFETEAKTEKFQIRVLWLENKEDKYIRHYEVEFQNRATADLDAFREGQKVQVEVEPRGWKFTTKAGEEKIKMSLTAKGIRKI